MRWKFLQGLWNDGDLLGATAAEDFEVSMGLETTMTAEAILDGIMRVVAKVALTRPAKFIVITYAQEMATSS